MFDVAGFILVGGASSRMGSDKAQLLFNGRTSLELIAAELSAAVSSVTLVGARQEYRRLALKNVPDLHERWGALGGIHSALAVTEKKWAAVVACDLPFVTRDLFARLMSLIDETNDAVIPMQPDGRPQPLCALYRRESCLPEVSKLIAEGEHTPRALLANVRTRWVEFDELRDLPGADNFFFNVNTPADFELARKTFKESDRR
jgi:molybdopterin-guanine dinucleotide biosynthesis protein A